MWGSFGEQKGAQRCGSILLWPRLGVGTHLGRLELAVPGLSPLCVLGVDFRVKSLLVDNKTFALQLWDTAGQER